MQILELKNRIIKIKALRVGSAAEWKGQRGKKSVNWKLEPKKLSKLINREKIENNKCMNEQSLRVLCNYNERSSSTCVVGGLEKRRRRVGLSTQIMAENFPNLGKDLNL